jgi:hypothetical protein
MLEIVYIHHIAQCKKEELSCQLLINKNATWMETV